MNPSISLHRGGGETHGVSKAVGGGERPTVAERGRITNQFSNFFYVYCSTFGNDCVISEVSVRDKTKPNGSNAPALWNDFLSVCLVAPGLL